VLNSAIANLEKVVGFGSHQNGSPFTFEN